MDFWILRLSLFQFWAGTLIFAVKNVSKSPYFCIFLWTSIETKLLAESFECFSNLIELHQKFSACTVKQLVIRCTLALDAG